MELKLQGSRFRLFVGSLILSCVILVQAENTIYLQVFHSLLVGDEERQTGSNR